MVRSNTQNENQLSLFEIKSPTPAEEWQEEEAKHALDELFYRTSQYRTGKSYMELISFVSRFRFYSPYNAMLLHIQMPGALYVAPAHRWDYQYGRSVIPTARPLVILQPMGPVMFVFDVSDTEPGTKAKELPPEIIGPFNIQKGTVGHEYEQTIENAKRDGIMVQLRKEGSQSAGSIRCVEEGELRAQKFQTGTDKHRRPILIDIPTKYGILMNDSLGHSARYVTMVHELAHLYCGHMGTPNKKWWPDRLGLQRETREFEAESVTHLICGRLNIETPSDSYLSCYMEKDNNIPAISLECVMKAAGLIEKMGKERLKTRKEKE